MDYGSKVMPTSLGLLPNKTSAVPPQSFTPPANSTPCHDSKSQPRVGDVAHLRRELETSLKMRAPNSPESPVPSAKTTVTRVISDLTENKKHSPAVYNRKNVRINGIDDCNAKPDQKPKVAEKPKTYERTKSCPGPHVNCVIKKLPDLPMQSGVLSKVSQAEPDKKTIAHAEPAGPVVSSEGEKSAADACNPAKILMTKIEDSLEMPLVDFVPLPAIELVVLLSLYYEDFDRARIHFISEWNQKVNDVLTDVGLSESSNLDRNVVSLVLSKLNSDKLATYNCLMNEDARSKFFNYKEMLQKNFTSEVLATDGLTVKPLEKHFGIETELWKGCVEEVIAASWDISQQTCQICWEIFSPDQIFGLSCCECIICNSCMKTYFTLMIQEGHVADFVCPVCHRPDIDEDSPHFQLLEQKLKFLLPKVNFEAYQRKMTEWGLMKEPNFQWCINAACNAGFLTPESGRRAVCPECKTEMCLQCKKRWGKQHENLTCEKYIEWKQNNDPHFQEIVLARQLQEQGIDCPKCHRRYLLSRGGCMHFTCTFCRHEFCSVCAHPFLRSCALKWCQQSGGLHCHHPRNCLYYLRDKSVAELQELLSSNGHQIDTNSQNNVTSCSVLEEKDTLDGFVLGTCKKPVLPEHAGLCENHYKEHLVGILLKEGIDPVNIMSESELVRELTKSSITDIPKQLKEETSDQFRSRLSRMVSSRVSLSKRS